MKKTKIICTMGPNTNDESLMRKLVQNGMDIARFNFSHGDHEEQKGRMDMLKKIREEENKPIAILLDTKGPEIRTGVLKDGQKVQLEAGETFTLTTDEIVGDNKIVSITYKGLVEDVKAGSTILIDDGLIELKVKDKKGNNINCEVVNGGELGEKKGVNVPNVAIRLPAITDKDRDDLKFGVEQGVDFIAASFVRNAECILEIKSFLRECKAPYIPVIAKIENFEAIKNIDEIIRCADGIMVARGDLGVEIPAEEVPYLQKTIIQKCNDNFKPVITATQMLDSMMRNPRPTRAEVTDVANAVYDGTDAVMLSGETAQGKYPLEALQMMVHIVENTEEHLDYDMILRKAGELEKLYYGEKLYGTHADLEDEEQTMYVPEVETVALNKETETHHALADGTVELLDTVKYRNLLPGRNYTLHGMIVEKETGNPVSEERTLEFVPEKSEGSVELGFEISADELCGKTIVVYEEIKADGKSIAEHKDPEAKEQSIYFPEIGTKALDENSKTQEGEAKEKQKIIDQITYKNLLPDETYVLKGVLMDKETGKELLDENGKRVTAGISFVPENEEGTIEMTFELDARRLAGKSVVVFERLYDEEEHLIAKEEDIENADQTVLYRKQEIPKNTIVEKPGHNSKEVRKSPKTGDENRMDLWLVMLCVCGIAVVTEIVIYKRRNR